MPIHFRCPHCEKLLALGTRKAGTQIHCPMCDGVITVPPRTEVQMPTTTVVLPDSNNAWWMDAPPVLPPPAPPTGVDAWWLSANAAPAENANSPQPPSDPPPSPEAIPSSAVVEPNRETSASGEHSLRDSATPAFPIGLIYLLAALVVITALGALLLLLSH